MGEWLDEQPGDRAVKSRAIMRVPAHLPDNRFFQSGGVVMCLSDEVEDTQRVLIDAAIKASGIPHQTAWERYVEYTGLVDTFEVYAYLQGLMSLPVVECNLLAHAVNELIDERSSPLRAPHRLTAIGLTSVK